MKGPDTESGRSEENTSNATDEGATATASWPTRIVGIGASAGGLESLERLFAHLPADTGMAFVVVQHLSPDFKSLMDELLARRTSMPVRLAEHGMAVEANAVYLLPPQKEMIIRQQRLLLNDKDPRHGLALPIDLFFRSLAHDAGARAVAVILSGSGSDGSRGIQDVSRAGGVVLCETTDTAKFSGMPMSAMRSGTVDQVLPPEEIAMAIAALNRPGEEALEPAQLSPEERGVDAIMRLLRDEYAIDFSHYKGSTVARRIERRLALNRSINLDTYVDQLRSDPRELNSLYEDLLIGVTRFFRDEQAFELLGQRIIPDLIERTPPEEQIRVWVPGCATGQEAYSIAMMLLEQLEARNRQPRLKILATDVHKASLEVASTGTYTHEQVIGISPERLQRFFIRRPNGYQANQVLRETIVFAPHNLIRDAPFTKLDLITCRNLLIYFQPHAQKTVLTLFHFCLKPGGYLFLGSSESPGGLIDEFDTIDEHSKIYRKRRDIALPRDLKLPLARGASPRLPTISNGRVQTVDSQVLALYDRLLDRFMPPSFLVDEDGQLVDTFGGAEAFLRVKSRRPTNNLLEMLIDDLRTLVSAALHRLRRDLQPVRYSGVSLPGEPGRYSLVVDPVRDGNGTMTHMLVSLVDPTRHAVLAGGGAAEMPVREVAHDRGPAPVVEVESGAAPVDAPRLHALQEELAYTKENLQATIEELETTNEELQATNEELMASNEELQSTNEELHSVNEELYTVNAEYQKKNAELQELNDDIEHLLDRTDVGTMFLDRDLCIRKFTPRIEDTFDVLEQDIGRPLRAFVHRLRYPTLMADVERVLREGDTVEAETRDDRGRCLFLRILPYRARTAKGDAVASPSPGSIGTRPDEGPARDGVVITITDISPLEQAREKLAQVSAIVESSGDAIIGKALDGTITTWNQGAERLYGYSEADAVGRHVRFLYPPGREHEIDAVIACVEQGDAVERHETQRARKDGSLVNVSATFSPIRNQDGDLTGVSEISRDITLLIRVRQEVADREERIRLLLDSTAEAILGLDLSGVCTFCNAACARLLGYASPQELIGRQMHQLIHHTTADGRPYPPEQSPIFESMRHREEAHVDHEVLWRADGTSFPAEYWSHPITSNGQVLGAVVTFIDITERKRTEREIQDGVQRREQFLAMLSHELRNPLAAILSATHLLEAEALQSAAGQKAASVIDRQARHMARLLDDLLDVARITRGHIALNKQLIDLRDTSRAAIEALGPFMNERDTQLSVDIPDEPVMVVGDPARLQQVQANLLSNAAKYSPAGARVRFELAIEGEQARIRVSDEGRGISSDMLPRIFDLFVQGDQSLDRSDGGLGVGLTLLRSLVELHDGRVDAESDGPGAGSCFTVWLPLAPSPAATVDVSADGTPRVRRVVVVEDQEDAREMIRLLLESEGLQVFTAENGLEGAEMIERIRPELAIVDIGLPVMDGFELARRVRVTDGNTRLIALSGYGQDADVQAAYDAGFDEHMTKPADPQRLTQVVLDPPPPSRRVLDPNAGSRPTPPRSAQ